MLDSDKIKTILELASQNLSGRKIAEQLGIDRKTVYSYLHEHRDTVQAAHFSDLEEFVRENKLSRLDRLKRLHSFKERVDKVLAEMDLEVLEPDVLVALNLRLEKQIANEIGKVNLYVGEENAYYPNGTIKSSKEKRLKLDP